MPPRENNAKIKGLQYKPPVPSFIAKMQRKVAGIRSPSPPSPPRVGADGRVREALPERPTDGTWAGGSDDEGEVSSKVAKGKGKEVDISQEEAWEERWGGGGDDDGPQIVVLKEGRHLTKEDVDNAKKGIGASKTRPSPSTPSTNKPPPEKSQANSFSTSSKGPPKSTQALKAEALSQKRKAQAAEPLDERAKKKERKKEKEKKVLLSFGEDEEE